MSAERPAANERELERLIGHKNGCPHLFFEQGKCNCGGSAAIASESKGDGETWEDYAHRLEGRIKQQRDHIKHLTELRAPGDIKARNRIAMLERLLGKKELALARQHDGLAALKARVAELEGES